MKLISVSNGRMTATEGTVDYIVTVDPEDGNGNQAFDYSYAPDDPYGLAPTIGAYLAENIVTISAYVAPAPLPQFATSLGERLAALESVLIQASIVKQSDLDNAVTNIAPSAMVLPTIGAKVDG